MVAVIHSGRGIRAVLTYNENKVKEQVATCIEAAGYPLEAGDLSYQQKLVRFEKLLALNSRTKVNTVHISLNFDPSERLSADQMAAIAREYMELIGFGDQPYLVYQHMDSGHPHCHIVTTNIRPDGRAINLHNLGKVKSERARKELEKRYGLIKAEDHSKSLEKIKPVDASRIQYGKSDTRRAIYNVLSAVLKSYKYTSLTELNAVLGLYNVAAETGSEGSRTRKHNGLFYRVLDQEKQQIGVPIKASLFPDSPGMKFLEGRFKANDVLRLQHKSRVKSSIDFALLHAKVTITEMIRELERKGIDTVLRQNDQGRLYGITFIDHQNKCVWNGSDLGKQYSAAGILQRCKPDARAEQMAPGISGETLAPGDSPRLKDKGEPVDLRATGKTQPPAEGDEKGILDELMQVEYGADQVPYEWRKKRRKKKRNQSKNL